MKRIGIVAHGGLFTTELTNEDRYYFGNNYNKKAFATVTVISLI